MGFHSLYNTVVGRFFPVGKSFAFIQHMASLGQRPGLYTNAPVVSARRCSASLRVLAVTSRGVVLIGDEDKVLPVPQDGIGSDSGSMASLHDILRFKVFLGFSGGMAASHRASHSLEIFFISASSPSHLPHASARRFRAFAPAFKALHQPRPRSARSARHRPATGIL